MYVRNWAACWLTVLNDRFGPEQRQENLRAGDRRGPAITGQLRYRNIRREAAAPDFG